ncbi:hypothetical protein, partial [Sunxiuqinia dokdonensis]
LLSIPIYGCTEKVDSYDVYNDVLLQVIGTERYHVPFVTIFDYDSITQKKIWNDFIEAKNRPVNNRRLFLAIYDTLDFHAWDLEKVRDLANKVSSKDSILIYKLIRANSKKELVDLKRMPVIGRYELYQATHGKELGLRDFFKDNKNQYSEVGMIRLSNVVFGENKETGCFFYEIIDPGGHGHPSKIIFVEKTFNKWTIAREDYF